MASSALKDAIESLKRARNVLGVDANRRYTEALAEHREASHILTLRKASEALGAGGAPALRIHTDPTVFLLIAVEQLALALEDQDLERAITESFRLNRGGVLTKLADMVKR